MKKFDGIIFDVDGTLASTNDLIFASFNYITKKYMNKTLTNEEIISLFGPTEDGILKNWFKEKYPEVSKDYHKYYRDKHHIADLYPGIKDLLKFIKSKNILLSIYTGKGREAALITLEVLEILGYFDMIVTGDDVKEHKPSPEGIEVFINKFNLDKEKVLMIGDSTGDIKAAHAAGVKIASVLWDSYARDKVLLMDSDFIFNSVDKLKEFLIGNI
jgi:pyrophosphatase PpaX